MSKQTSVNRHRDEFMDAEDADFVAYQRDAGNGPLANALDVDDPAHRHQLIGVSLMSTWATRRVAHAARPDASLT